MLVSQRPSGGGKCIKHAIDSIVDDSGIKVLAIIKEDDPFSLDLDDDYSNKLQTCQDNLKKANAAKLDAENELAKCLAGSDGDGGDDRSGGSGTGRSTTPLCR